MSNVNELIDRATVIVGTVSALAERIGVTQSAVSNWKARGNVPAEYCPAIERETGGVVTAEQLRPDVDWAFIRGNSVRVAA